MTPQYQINRQDGTVTIFGADPIRDESDLIAMLSDLQAGDATLAELAGS